MFVIFVLYQLLMDHLLGHLMPKFIFLACISTFTKLYYRGILTMKIYYQYFYDKNIFILPIYIDSSLRVSLFGSTNRMIVDMWTIAIKMWFHTKQNLPIRCLKKFSIKARTLMQIVKDMEGIYWLIVETYSREPLPQEFWQRNWPSTT